eukprot:m.282715 g.282715  ORF g.282715 m.282715 type:complete len:679 (-) comp19861_c0_seq1:23-2059(-)
MNSQNKHLLLILFSFRLLSGFTKGNQVMDTSVNSNIVVDFEASAKPFNHFWKASVGSGHAKLGLRQDWQSQLKHLHDTTGVHGVRFHGTFDDDMGPVVTGSAASPVYNFTLVDELYDAIVAAGVTPIVELSFMPQVLANCTPGKCPTTMHYRGISTVPKTYECWHDLVKVFAEHLVERHGISMISTWRFEVWNELWGVPWGANASSGKQQDSSYMALYNASYVALKSVSPKILVGGPATEEVQHVSDFVDALSAWNIDADFVSTHLYPTDWCTSEANASRDSDCFTNAILDARSQAPNHAFYMTEFNCGWKNNLIHDGESHAYAASFFLRTINALKNHDIGALSWWTFSSIFEEQGLPTNEFGPFGANSAMQSVHGIPMPIYRVFELLAGAGNVSHAVEINGVLRPSDMTLAVLATSNTTLTALPDRHGNSTEVTNTLGPGEQARTISIYLSNFLPDFGADVSTDLHKQDASNVARDTCNASEWLSNTDFAGGDLLPEAKKFRTNSSAACCEACRSYVPVFFCDAWVWKDAKQLDPRRCYLKSKDAIGHKRHAPGLTAGFPGAPPAPPTPHHAYNTTRRVTVALKGLRNPDVSVRSRTINSTCANPKRVWTDRMQSIAWPTTTQLDELMEASRVCEESLTVSYDGNGFASVTVSLEAYATVQLLITQDTPSTDYSEYH